MIEVVVAAIVVVYVTVVVHVVVITVIAVVIVFIFLDLRMYILRSLIKSPIFRNCFHQSTISRSHVMRILTQNLQPFFHPQKRDVIFRRPF